MSLQALFVSLGQWKFMAMNHLKAGVIVPTPTATVSYKNEGCGPLVFRFSTTNAVARMEKVKPKHGLSINYCAQKAEPPEAVHVAKRPATKWGLEVQITLCSWYCQG